MTSDTDLSKSCHACEGGSVFYFLVSFLLLHCDISLAFPLPDQELEDLTLTTLRIPNTPDKIRSLVEQGYDIAGMNLEHGTIDIITPRLDDNWSTNFLGFQIQSRRNVTLSNAPEDEYKNSDEVEQLLKGYADNYPHLVSLESIGKSVQHRNIWAIKITDHPEKRETEEPQILFNAMHHAREVMSTEVSLDIVEYLITRYGTDPAVTKWIENNEIWVVPMINVDGNNKIWNGNNMWRKNVSYENGVDINRNYPYAWGNCNGSSGNPISETYRGPYAASEPETQALMGLVARIQPTFNISFHSYSEIVIYPYGCEGQRTESTEIVEEIGQQIAKLLPRDSGHGTYAAGTSWELLYPVDGGDIDWMYHQYHVLPFVIEVNSSFQGFQPPYHWRQPTVEKMRNGWQMLLERSNQSGIRGIVSDDQGHPTSTALVHIQKLNQKPHITHSNWKVKADGTYHFVLRPGRYQITFQAGNRSLSHSVTIDKELIRLDAQI